MNYPVVFSDEAKTDVSEAFSWYDRIQVGLGEEFISALEVSLTSIKGNPLANAEKPKRYRIALLRRFPFKVVYQIFSPNIVVIGVIHHSRNPRLIQRRAK
jgi:hypothetical protein